MNMAQEPGYCSFLSDQPPKACQTIECLPIHIRASSPRYKGYPKKRRERKTEKKKEKKSIMSIPSSKELSTAFCVPFLTKRKGDPNFARLQKEGAEGQLFHGGNQPSVDSSPTAAPARQLSVLSEEWAAPAHPLPGSCLSL